MKYFIIALLIFSLTACQLFDKVIDGTDDFGPNGTDELSVFAQQLKKKMGENHNAIEKGLEKLK